MLFNVLVSTAESGKECQANDRQQASRDIYALASQIEEDANGGRATRHSPARQQNPPGEDGSHHDN